MTRGLVFNANDVIKWSWRWADEGPSRFALPVTRGDRVLYINDEADDDFLMEVHTSIHFGWTLAEVAARIGASRCEVVAVPDLPDGQERQWHTGLRALDAQAAPAAPRTKAEILAR